MADLFYITINGGFRLTPRAVDVGTAQLVVLANSQCQSVYVRCTQDISTRVLEIHPRHGLRYFDAGRPVPLTDTTPDWVNTIVRGLSRALTTSDNQPSSGESE